MEADRYRSEIRPWISLQALLQGSTELLHGYPPEDVQEIRAAWGDARTAYLNRGDSESAGQFVEAIERFTSRVRTLAEAIEPDRQQLPIVERDRGLLAKTAYPAAFATDAEVFYNRVDPFSWSGWASLAAAGILGLSFLVLRKPLFWIGIVMMVVGVGLVAVGFAVRMYITRWAPVTSMFETVVWVAMCVSVLTLWVTFLPLLGPTSKIGWQLTAIRRSKEQAGYRAAGRGARSREQAGHLRSGSGSKERAGYSRSRSGSKEREAGNKPDRRKVLRRASVRLPWPCGWRCSSSDYLSAYTTWALFKVRRPAGDLTWGRSCPAPIWGRRRRT